MVLGRVDRTRTRVRESGPNPELTRSGRDARDDESHWAREVREGVVTIVSESEDLSTPSRGSSPGSPFNSDLAKGSHGDKEQDTWHVPPFSVCPGWGATAS